MLQYLLFTFYIIRISFGKKKKPLRFFPKSCLFSVVVLFLVVGENLLLCSNRLKACMSHAEIFEGNLAVYCPFFEV